MKNIIEDIECVDRKKDSYRLSRKRFNIWENYRVSHEDYFGAFQQMQEFYKKYQIETSWNSSGNFYHEMEYFVKNVFKFTPMLRYDAKLPRKQVRGMRRFPYSSRTSNIWRRDSRSLSPIGAIYREKFFPLVVNRIVMFVQRDKSTWGKNE